MHHEHPELIRDQYWDQVFPTELPYTVAAGERERHPEPSTANIAVSDADAEYSLPPKGCDDGQAIVSTYIINLSYHKSFEKNVYFINRFEIL